MYDSDPCCNSIKFIKATHIVIDTPHNSKTWHFVAKTFPIFLMFLKF